MPKKVPALYPMESTRQVAEFMDTITDKVASGASKREVFDSVCNESGVSAPAALQPLLGSMKEKDEHRILDGVVDGIEVYVREHGHYPTADVVEAAIQQGHAAMIGLTDVGTARALTLDSASSSVHDQGSLQPNRAVVAILSCLSEAIPWASYLPVDIGSNEARLAIMSHSAMSSFGGYTAGDLMDGTSNGKVYTSSQRMALFDVTGAAPYNRKFTQRNLTDSAYCDPAATGLAVYRGRTTIYVNGIPVANDQISGTSANSPFTGSGTLPSNGVTYTLTGYVTIAGGDIQITSITGGTLPAGTVVSAKGIINFETQSSLAPVVGVNATVYQLFANASRVLTKLGIDSDGQLRNELGLDPMSEALMAVRAQLANERHFQAILMAMNLGLNNVVDLDFDFAGQGDQKTRSMIWQDHQGVFGNADQNMANLTMDHGMTHIYAPGYIIAQWESMGGGLWEPSGVPKRPGIYRAGRLFGKYEVYYTPRVASQAANLQTATLLAVGRSTNVARNPIVLGDAVAPTFVEMSTGADFNKQSGMYVRDFTEANPHIPSALGCARINVTNLL